ncbi:MAG: DNA-3-methyladenine glycosylase 2 family protein [bacterium]|nr:DNA-3-methyladenine glycosylase 2 family protein [bacterium]
MSKKVLEHFKKNDLVMFELALKVNDKSVFDLKKSDNFFLSLCREIIGQQLAGKAAHAIFNRFLNLFPKQEINKELILKIPEQILRDAGMAWAKVRALKDLASKTKNGEVNLKKLEKMVDKEVITELTKIKGIGPWTAEMFLMFSLAREDVYSFKDLGLRKAIKRAYEIDDLTESKAEKISLNWSPFKTYACRILWKSLDR